MLRTTATALFLALLVGCGGGGGGGGPQDPLDPGQQPEPLTPSPKQPFSVVVLPDTQYYSLGAPEIYEAQAEWIVDQREERNIKFVIHVGDLTHKNSTSSPNEWQRASDAHEILEDANVPYSVVPGNHDMYPKERLYLRDYTNLNEYFPPMRFVGAGGSLAGSENNYTLFESEGLKFLVLSLEFTPRKDSLQWANQVLEDHPLHRVIVATHANQRPDGSYDHVNDSEYDLVGADGAELWDEFVSRHSNIFLSLSGHHNGSIHRVRTAANTSFGNEVHEILTDFQHEGANGDGWLRVLTFDPEDGTGTVTSEVLSVLDGITTLLELDDYPELPSDPQHAFSFSYDLQSPVTASQIDVTNARFGDRTVNSVDSGDQLYPQVAVASNGDFVVVWRDSGNENDIYVRGFTRGGWERFADIAVSGVNTGRQEHPAVAMDDGGRFVVVWEDDRNRNGKFEIRARGFNADGTKWLDEFVVNTESSGQQLEPDIAMDPSGNFVVVWKDDKDGNGLYQIYARGFYANGSERFADMTVNSTAAGQQSDPAVAMDDSGRFVVVWEDDEDNAKFFWQIYARGLEADGTPWVGLGDFRVSSDRSGRQRDPDVAMDSAGNFVVVWEDDRNFNDNYQIRLRGIDATGKQYVAEQTANTESAGDQQNPDVSMDASGRFVVAWDDDQDENGLWQLYARGFQANGVQWFVDRNVNDDNDGQQQHGSVGLGNEGVWVAAWHDDLDDNGKWQILARGMDD